MVTKIGLDLGYANITLCDVTSGIYREPSIALVNKETRRILAVGNEAINADGGEVGMLVRPFKNGLLFDGQITKGVIERAISAVKPAEKIRCIIGVPIGFLPKQEKEIFEMMSASGVEECFAVTRSVAAIIGAGYSPGISAISVNVGAKHSEISVLYRGRVIMSEIGAIGGEDFDKAVRQYILDQGDVNVSLSVSRSIKEHLGAVWHGKEAEPLTIEGTLSLTGNKVKMTVDTEDFVGVFEKPLYDLLHFVADTVKRIPFDFVEEIFENGIVLTGGGADLYGLEIMMAKVLGIAVTKPNDAIDCVSRGLSRINTIMPLKMRSNNKNITSQLLKFYEAKKQSN